MIGEESLAWLAVPEAVSERLLIHCSCRDSRLEAVG